MTDTLKKIVTATTGAITATGDAITDQIEKVSSPASRAGHVVERAGKMDEANVDHDVIALQMTKRSPTKTVYTARDVNVLANVYQDSKTTVLLTAKQSRALIEDEKQNNPQVTPDLDAPMSA
ncbi:MAG: hypothetical protein PHE74_12945 [Comamonas sp.]|nr:hypothetical protein [Comamonas sp.]